MAETFTKLSLEALVARAAKGNVGQLELRDNREPGLRFRAGERSAGWSLLVRLRNGQRSRIKLGTWPAMGIAEARNAARSTRLDIEQGGDPNERKRVTRRTAAAEAMKRMTLGEVLDEYSISVLSQLRTGDATRRALDGDKGILRTLSHRKPSSILREEILSLVKKSAKAAPISANRKLAYASAFFNWCVDEGILPLNPAASIRRPSRERQRDRFHSLAELREIWAAAGTLAYPFEQLFRLLIVLPNRRQEIASMEINDLDLADDDHPGDGAWLLRSERTKKGNALRIPLSPLARLLILDAVNASDRPKGSKFVFSTTGDTPISGFTKGRRRLDSAIQAARVERAGDIETAPMPHWVTHDLRTTFNTHCCEILNVPPHVADRILNHVATATRSKIMRVYNKSELFEPRREALSAWADLILARVVENDSSERAMSGVLDTGDLAQAAQ